jgi:EEF1A N-terminal glycine/lysine methyltransferase
MSIGSRVTLSGSPATEPEDHFSDSLGTIFPNDVTNQHGDNTHGLVYTSPHLPRPLKLTLADVTTDEDRCLFSHYLWNSSLLLAELVEAGTLHLPNPTHPSADDGNAQCGQPWEDWDVTGLSTVELGAGTALPSMMAALLGAGRVLVTDYPTVPVLETLKTNIATGVQPENSPLGSISPDVEVAGLAWGDVTSAPAAENRGHFDRVLVADCLWMPWQHEDLRRSVAWFLSDDAGARAWVVAGIHTGRAKMCRFFDEQGLKSVGLEIEKIWERDCDGAKREWLWDRGTEDVSERKRWLAVAVLRRCRSQKE